MIVELRRDEYESELFDESLRSINNGMLLDDHEREKEFNWNTRNRHNGTRITDMQWAHQLSQRESRMTDEVLHFSLKGDLVEHIWNRYGNI